MRKNPIWPALCISVLALVTLAEGCSSRQTAVLDLSGTRSTPLPPINGVNTNFFFAPERVSNECYLPKLVGGIGGPSGYLKRAHVALGVLRAGGYRGAVGLVVAPDRKSSRYAFRRWTERIARADTSDFDAVILHDYTSLENKNLEALAPGITR